jgi:peptide/nickel transport system permease protein
MQAAAGLQTGEPLSLPEVIFSQVNDYTLGVSALLLGPGSVSFSDIGLVAQGTAFGLLGTDSRGSDLFAEDMHGSRISLFVGLVSAFIGITLGLLVGLVAGYKTGLTDEVLMRFTDMMLVLPVLPLLLVLITVLGPSILNIIILIGFLGWMGFARVIRSQVLSLKVRPFIEAAKAAGAGTGRILTAHVFPNVVSLTYVNLALAVPVAILTEAALSFLGLGDPTTISWGQIISNAQVNNALKDWWWIIPPGIAIAFVSLSFVLIGYALDEIFNPRLRRRR